MHSYIAKNGKTEYGILLSKNPTGAEQFAAAELKEFIFLASGAEMKICYRDDLPESRFIAIGAKASPFVQPDSNDEYAKQGYCIRTQEGRVFIDSSGDWGKIYGVYAFLKRVIGFEVYAHDEIAYQQGDIPYKEIDLADKPDFIGRDTHEFVFFRDLHPYLPGRMRLNGVRSKFLETDGAGSAWSQKAWAHTQFKILPPENYYAAHPDWYSVSDGKPRSLCWTNDGAAAEFSKNLMRLIDDEPDKIFFSICQEDGAVPCQCTECRTSDARFTHSGTMMRYVNRIARQVSSHLDKTSAGRRVYLSTFAYQDTLDPPVIETKDGGYIPIHPSVVAEDNVMIRLAPLYNCYSHEVTDERCNGQTKRALTAWSAICKNLSIWSYCTGFGAYYVPFNWFKTMQQNYRAFKAFGVLDILDQGVSDTTGAPLQALRCYVGSKLLWNTDADFNTLVSDFFLHYFQQAAPHMTEYFEGLQAHYTHLEMLGRQKDDGSTGDWRRATEKDGAGIAHWRPSWRFSVNYLTRENFPKRFLEQELDIFSRALQAIDGEGETREKVRKRLLIESMSPKFMYLELYLEELPYREAVERINEFRALIDLSHVRCYREGDESNRVTTKTREWTKRLYQINVESTDRKVKHIDERE